MSKQHPPLFYADETTGDDILNLKDTRNYGSGEKVFDINENEKFSVEDSVRITEDFVPLMRPFISGEGGRYKDATLPDFIKMDVEDIVHILTKTAGSGTSHELSPQFIAMKWTMKDGHDNINDNMMLLLARMGMENFEGTVFEAISLIFMISQYNGIWNPSRAYAAIDFLNNRNSKNRKYKEARKNIDIEVGKDIDEAHFYLSFLKQYESISKSFESTEIHKSKLLLSEKPIYIFTYATGQFPFSLKFWRWNKDNSDDAVRRMNLPRYHTIDEMTFGKGSDSFVTYNYTYRFGDIDNVADYIHKLQQQIVRLENKYRSDILFFCIDYRTSNFMCNKDQKRYRMSLLADPYRLYFLMTNIRNDIIEEDAKIWKDYERNGSVLKLDKDYNACDKIENARYISGENRVSFNKIPDIKNYKLALESYPSIEKSSKPKTVAPKVLTPIVEPEQESVVVPAPEPKKPTSPPRTRRRPTSPLSPSSSAKTTAAKVPTPVVEEEPVVIPEPTSKKPTSPPRVRSSSTSPSRSRTRPPSSQSPKEQETVMEPTPAPKKPTSHSPSPKAPPPVEQSPSPKPPPRAPSPKVSPPVEAKPAPPKRGRGKPKDVVLK